MQLLLVALLQVELVGGKSIYLELATPIAIVLAAIVGAHFAAQYAGRNVSKELAAADLRLQRELRHDQVIREKEAARRTLDEVTNVATDAMDAVIDYSARIKTAEDVARMTRNAPEASSEKNELKQALSDLLSEVSDNAEACHAATRKLRPAYVRLQLRFPESHPVSESFAGLIQAIKTTEGHEREHGKAPRDDEELAEAARLRAEVPSSLNLYLAAARSWMEKVIDEGI
ncbi:MAG TPA: hypothetical protein VF009_05500 [Solirubrobacterales bacterium]